MGILVAGACSSFDHTAQGSRQLSEAPTLSRRDGRSDRAYQRRAGEPSYENFLVVCLAGGRSDELEIGQAEGTFYTADLDHDGRSEIIYGGTSVSQVLEVLAVVSDGRLVTSDGDSPVLASGPSGPDWENIGQGWGCEDTDGDGRREVIQVTVHRKGSEASWTKEAYRVDRARLILLRTTTGTVRATEEPSEQAEGLVPNC